MWHAITMQCRHNASSWRWRAMAASKVVLRCCLYSRSVHQHLGHGLLSCQERRLQVCFGQCMRARGLSCGMQSRCDVVTTQGLGGWRARAASKAVPRCCPYNRSVHQHLGHGPLSCRQRRLQNCFGRCACRPALGDACVLEASHVACNHDATSSQRKVYAGDVRWHPRKWCCGAVYTFELYISTLAMDH